MNSVLHIWCKQKEQNETKQNKTHTEKKKKNKPRQFYKPNWVNMRSFVTIHRETTLLKDLRIAKFYKVMFAKG